MLRKFLTTGVLVACAGAFMLANERATYILSDGARKSGQIVSHGSERQSLINGVLSLGNDTGGPEFNFPVGQVAVIDFAGGQPGPSELSQLPASGQLLALRNGQTQQGTFVNMINGETLIWRDQSGNTQQYPIDQVARVYLNADTARTAYNYTGPSATGSAVGTSGQTNAPAGSVQVQANQAWNDGGITVKKGDRVAFNTTGQINFGPNPGMSAGPDGNGSMHKPDYPVPAMPVGGLIGRVGTSAPFPIGSNTQPIVMPADGRLMLGVNDNQLGDNSGAFTVTVTKTSR
jgi:PA-IL-like protein